MDDYSNPYQQTDQWFADRCGCLTASRAAAVINVSKRDGQPLKSYFDLINTIVSERVTGIVDVTPTTSAMQWGIDNEEVINSPLHRGSSTVSYTHPRPH